MALYREGKAGMAADGTVTGTGTKWQSSLSLIRPGATIMFLSSPIQMAVVNRVVSNTEIKAITTNGAVVASTDYAILLSDSLTVDGLAQDVAETLRYYQSQETAIADAVEFFKTFDFESLQNLANQIKADSEAAEASAAAAAVSEYAAKTSETNSKASEVAAETARDQVQKIINDAGEQSTLVVLAQGDGFSHIGRCPDIASLRKTKPLYHGQAILLHKAIENGPDVNVLLSYDALDTTSSDDDCAIFVTEDGARWKYDLSNGYNTSLAGYNPAENNMAAVINKITAVITDNVIAAGKILGIPTTITLPNYQDNTHIMDEALVIPPFVSLRANTQHVFKFSNDSYGIKICTDFNSALSWSVVTNGFPSGNGDSGYKIYDGPRLIVMGPGRDSSTKSGILIGNKTNNSKAPVRDIDVAGIYVSGFKAVLEYGNYNTYNTFATNIHGEQNQYGLFTDDTSTQSNSGETHVLRDCTLSQNSKAHCHIGTRNIYFDLYSCHLDYAPNVFEFGEFSWWARVTTYGGWFEGFENLAEAMGTGFTGAPELNMINPIIDARGYYESTWGGPRKIFKTTAGGRSKTLYVNLTDPKISFPKKPAYPSTLLSGLVTGYPTGDVTNSNIGIKTSYIKYKADTGYYPYPYLGHSSESLCGSSFAVGTPTGSQITNNFRGLEFRTSGSGTVVLVAADANYADQLSFDVTLTSAADYVDVTSLARIKLKYGDIVAATISVMPKEATGAIKVAPALYHYSADKVVSTLLGDNTIKNSITRNLIETTAPDASAYTDVLSYLSDTGTPATRNSFIGSQPTLAAMRNVWVYGDYTTEGQYEYSNLAIRLTGFVGTIRVMLPLWWKV